MDYKFFNAENTSILSVSAVSRHQHLCGPSLSEAPTHYFNAAAAAAATVNLMASKKMELWNN